MDDRPEEDVFVGSSEPMSEERTITSLKVRIWREVKMIWRIALPAVLARMSMFGVIVVTQAFVGHIGELELAAFSIVQTILVRFVSGITLGMSSATETLCGQAFGAKQYQMMGIYLQRSWIVTLSTTTLLVPLFVFAAPFFELIGEEKAIAVSAATIAQLFIPILYCTAFSATMQMYLQSQLRNIIIIWITVASLALHVLMSWVFVIKLGFGIGGAMAAINMSLWLVVLGEAVYIFGGWCPETWRGFSMAAFSDILPVVKLSVSSGVMLCLELWYTSVLVLLAGYMKNASVAITTFTICLSLATWVLTIGLGFLVAASVRVSNELGRGNPKEAKFSIKIMLAIATCLGAFFAVICLIFGYQMAFLFTSSAEVAESVSNLSVLLAFSVFLNSIQPVLTGVAIGAGWQSVVAFVNIGCYYGIGVPIGALLAYVAHLEVKGLWIGMISGVAAQTVALLYMTWKTNWDDQVNRASERLDRWLLKPSDSEETNVHTSED